MNGNTIEGGVPSSQFDLLVMGVVLSRIFYLTSRILLNYILHISVQAVVHGNGPR